jgi:DNA-binding MarR family transcriptional regulator
MLSLSMLSGNARIIQTNLNVGRRLFGSRSPITTDIIFALAANEFSLDLRDLLRQVDATPIATRQHITLLVDQGLLSIDTHPHNKRCKVVQLTSAAVAALKQYEVEFQDMIQSWHQV